MFLDIGQFKSERNYSIAIFVGKTDNGNHCGITAKANNEVKFYHLAWHEQFDCDSEKNLLEKDMVNLKWVRFSTLDISLDPLQSRSIALIKKLEHLQRKHAKSIPYGINYKETKFMDNDYLQLGESEHGLTCATFVACFFEGYAKKLVELNTWQVRDEDIDWKGNILKFMLRRLPEAHVMSVFLQPLKWRLRPEEITVASSHNPLPADYVFCSTNGAVYNLP